MCIFQIFQISWSLNCHYGRCSKGVTLYNEGMDQCNEVQCDCFFICCIRVCLSGYLSINSFLIDFLENSLSQYCTLKLHIPCWPFLCGSVKKGFEIGCCKCLFLQSSVQNKYVYSGNGVQTFIFNFII